MLIHLHTETERKKKHKPKHLHSTNQQQPIQSKMNLIYSYLISILFTKTTKQHT